MKRITLYFSIIGLFILSIAACNDGTAVKVAKGAQDVAVAVNAATKTVQALDKDGLITKDENLKIDLALLDVNHATQEFNNQIKGFTSVDSTNKAQLLALANNVVASVAKLNSEVQSISNPKAQNAISAACSAIQVSINVVIPYLEAK